MGEKWKSEGKNNFREIVRESGKFLDDLMTSEKFEMRDLLY
jgi:hypothetical protein